MTERAGGSGKCPGDIRYDVLYVFESSGDPDQTG
jgi:hypothetical protein